MKKLIRLLILLFVIGFLGLLVFPEYYPKPLQNLGLPDINLQAIKLKVFPPTPNEETIPINVEINKDLSSEIALIGISEDEQERFGAITKVINGTEQLDKVVLTNKENQGGIIDVDEMARPTSFVFQGVNYSFSNYTDTTVDILISFPDGRSEEHPNQPLNISSQKELSFIQAVHAAELPGIEPPQGASRKTYLDNGEDVFFDYALTSSVLAINIVRCSVVVASTIASGGWAAPFAYLSCGAVLGAVYKNYTNKPGCQGVLLDCFIEQFKKSLEPKGPTIGGIITDINGDPVQGAEIVISDKNGKTKAIAISGQFGHYVLPSLDIGGYNLVASIGTTTSSFVLAMTNDRIKIAGESKEALDSSYKAGERKSFKKVPEYFGREVDQLFNVRFDIQLGGGGVHDGTWTGEALSDSKFVEDPNILGEFTECTNASFSWDIAGSELSGIAKVDDYSLSLSGTVDVAGKITAGTGTSIYEQVDFTGQIRGEEVSGTWKAASGCKGSFFGSRESNASAPSNLAEPVF